MAKSKKLFIMCGIAGSGKSTWIQNHKNFFSGNTEIISRDNIRFSLVKEEEPYFSKEKEVWNKYITEAKISLKLNDNTILDATHLNEKSRSKILRALKNNLNNVEINVIVIDTPFKTIVEQNNLREGRSKVPLKNIRRMHSTFTIPTIDEGFDNIYIYKIKNGEPNYIIYTKEVR